MNKTQFRYEQIKKSGEDNEIKVAMDGTFAIASVGIATLEMLETLLPAAAKEVEHESVKITGHFMKILHYLHTQENPLPPEIQDAVSGITVGLQFQDRNTQIMENVTCILERYRSMLDEVCCNIRNMQDGNIASGQNIAHAVEHILSSIRLSDIRARYVEALAKAKVHSQEQSDKVQIGEENDKEIEIF